MSSKLGLVLFVDDEYYILQTLRAIFRREYPNYKFEYAQNGKEAFEILSSYAADDLKELLVFSDWLMPGLKGDDLLVQVHEMFPQSISFLLSGMINKEPSPDVFEKANIKQVIQKPWENDSLIELLGKYLQHP